MKHARSDYDHIQDLTRNDELMLAYDDAMKLQAKLPTMSEISLRQHQEISRTLSRLLQALYPLVDGGPTATRSLVPPDEPVFLLRAKDRTAPSVVRAWARLNQGNGSPLGTSGALPSAISKAALAQADRMEDYARTHYAGGKEADAPAGALRV